MIICSMQGGGYRSATWIQSEFNGIMYVLMIE